MNKIFIFFLLATCTVLLSVAVIAVGPITNKLIGDDWGYQNCQLLADQEKLMKGDVTKLKYMKNLCYRQKAMHDMEYTSFIINIVLGFICADLAFLHYLGYGKDFELKTGVIGLISGIIGFVLTLVYVCYSGYIFTKDVAYMTIDFDNLDLDLNEDGCIDKLFSNGAYEQFVEYLDDTNGWETIYENDRRDYANYIRYKELGKKRYNYDSDYYKKYYNYDKKENAEYTCGRQYPLLSNSDCDYHYKKPEETTFNKYLYDRWLSALVVACVVLLTNLGLAIFGLLLFTNFGANVNL